MKDWYKAEIISKMEAARRLGVSTRTIDRGIDRGLIEAVYNGLLANRVIGIKAASVAALLERRAHHA